MRVAQPMGKAGVLQKGCNPLKLLPEPDFQGDFVCALCNSVALTAIRGII